MTLAENPNDYKNYELKDFPDPWLNFRQDAEKSVEQILVSHKKQKSLLRFMIIKLRKTPL